MTKHIFELAVKQTGEFRSAIDSALLPFRASFESSA
jgi:hypothetical protein